ncbi:MAG: hypothetical protein LBO66_06870 [Deltaproteobacteria bacterium]|jgi:hypothetical protein|nr:hypothetical protein [Deltaproteobacteria bacterium]
MPSQIIHTTTTEEYASSAPESSNLTANFALLNLLLTQELGPEGASSVAEPVFKPVSQSVDWRTPLAGASRAYYQLDESAKKSANALLIQRAGQYAAFGEKLLLSTSEARKQAGRLIARLAVGLTGVVARTPGAPPIYLVGDQPVVIPWEVFSQYGRDPLPANAYSDIPELSAVLPQPPAPPAPPVTPTAPIPPVPPVPVERRELIQPIVEVRSTSFWDVGKILLAALISFLFLLVLFLLIFPGMRPLVAARSEPPLHAYDGDAAEAARLQSELRVLEGRYADQLLACAPDAVSPPAPVIPPPPAPVIPPPPAPVIPPPPVPVIPPPPVPVIPPAPVPPSRGQGLVIPVDPKPLDISLLAGCWLSDAELFNPANNLPLFDEYCFDENGRGTVRTEEMDSSGNLAGVCQGDLSAEFDGRNLVIHDEGASCAYRGSAYSPYDVECVPDENGVATCVATSREGGSSYEVEITRK